MIDSMSVLTVNDLKVNERTPNTAVLAWSAPLSGLPLTGYDIYRREVGSMGGRVSFSNSTISPTANVKAGSTRDLFFSDQGLRQDVIYEYSVVTKYESIPVQTSNLVRTDSVIMTGVPGTPTNLRVEKIVQGLKNDVVLRWDEAPPDEGPMAYAIYRKLTKAAAPAAEPDSEGRIVLSGTLDFGVPEMIGQSAAAEFTDKGLDYGDTCQYYVQASSLNGFQSFISSPLEVIVSVTAPTAPGNLKAGSVLRQGGEVRYDFSSNSGTESVLLGPQREAVLQWNPSRDNGKNSGI